MSKIIEWIKKLFGIRDKSSIKEIEEPYRDIIKKDPPKTTVRIVNNMPKKQKYIVNFYEGDYGERQAKANSDDAICYIEHHFNSSMHEVLTTADYAMCIVGSNASKKSIEWAKKYSHMIDKEFDEIKKVGGVDGVLVGGYGGRGDYNVRLTKMPAILVEPMFCNDPEHVKAIKSKDGRKRLANVLVKTIKECFPNGGLVAFSVGHKYKTSNKNDRGAPLYGGGTEADYAEKVLKIAKKILEGD